MASSSGTNKPVRRRHYGPVDSSDEDYGGFDSERVPPSLDSIVPILRVANKIERDNRRVAYLCRNYALVKATKITSDSAKALSPSGRGVIQFIRNLKHKCKKQMEDTKRILATDDTLEFTKFYSNFLKSTILDEKLIKTPEEMHKSLQIAEVLREVLKNLDSEIEEELKKKYAKGGKEKQDNYEPYNIIPMYAVGRYYAEHNTSRNVEPDLAARIIKPDIIELPEIEASIQALVNDVDKLIPLLNMPEEKAKLVQDILDWLSFVFGFQKGNVANQREHLILLLANKNLRGKTPDDDYNEKTPPIVINTPQKRMLDDIFKNYLSWCKYLNRPPNLKFDEVHNKEQLELLYIALYLLIWGEASNIRFMPECLCYIFHNMANEMYTILIGKEQIPQRRDEAFLVDVVTPIYEVLKEEVERNKKGKASHAAWRNYDDLNEYFWFEKCFELGWNKMEKTADFFRRSDETHPEKEANNQVVYVKRKPKINFVEVRTYWHLFRSFDRMWIFFILALQTMVIIAWHHNGNISVIFDGDVFKRILSISITATILNLFRAVLDIILSWFAWRSMESKQMFRYILKLVVAVIWAVVMNLTYWPSVNQTTGFWKFKCCAALYFMPNILPVFMFMFPVLRELLELSNWGIINVLMWWAQPMSYVARDMHEDMFSQIKYILFWIVVLISKLAFSYYVEILPLVKPSKIIMEMTFSNYEWHQLFPHGTRNIGVVIAIWAPVTLVYFMDTQIWYSIWSTLVGGIIALFNHLGEIRSIGMLMSRFESITEDFSKCMVVPLSDPNQQDNPPERKNIARFAQVWNAFIVSMRSEDLISNREKDLLLVPYSLEEVQWPVFLLASKVPIALDITNNYKREDDAGLLRKIKRGEDFFMLAAINECYRTLKDIILGLLADGDNKMIVNQIFDKVDTSTKEGKFLSKFHKEKLHLLNDRLEKFLELLMTENNDMYKLQIWNGLQDMKEIITRDVMNREHEFKQIEIIANYMFDETINDDITRDKTWKAKVRRLHMLLTVKESVINVPMNLDARRRMTFFANSLVMNIPKAPKVQDMLSFSVLTPYYEEDVLYSEKELVKENEDGISILFYLKTVYPDEWKNFVERMGKSRETNKLNSTWASYRGQTLSRTVRGMMYYREALTLQYFLDSRKDGAILGGSQTIDMDYAEDEAQSPQDQVQAQEAEDEDEAQSKDLALALAKAKALADIKFTYVISCQIYGAQKKSSNPEFHSCYTNILDLMRKYPSLSVAYIDEREEVVNGKLDKVWYSVLVKGKDDFDEEIYRIKLPGPPTKIGEGKPENQNHAIIFTRGEALQTIDMNQDNYFEEAFKMRNLLEEFSTNHGHQQKPTILGLREHIFTGSVSSLAWFMSNQETSFVTIGQRVLANPLRVRFHYGHPDIFDKIFHLTRGGISKASKTINLSEDIFSGYNSTLRGGYITHHEYIQMGKGRDVGMNQISLFETKVASGNGEQTLSRDVYRLGHCFDFFRMLSFYFTTVGFYFSSMLTVLTVYIFLYGRLYMIFSGMEKEILDNPMLKKSKALEEALVTPTVFQLGLLLVIPMLMEICLERGLRTAMVDFITMQLQLASVFFTFQLGTKAHCYGRTILHGGSKYQATGRGFVVFHARFSENYRIYSRSHFVKGLELFILLVVYMVYGESYRSSKLSLFITWSMWFLVASWLFAPFVFNPSGFEWQKTVEDWTDLKKWMGNHAGIGISPEKSWESWWNSEQEHLKSTNIRGRVCEFILALRFFVYQYGIVYHLHISHGSKNWGVYVLSWVFLIIVGLVIKMVSWGRRKCVPNCHRWFRILKALLFLGLIAVIIMLFNVCGLTVEDLFACILAFVPTGWAILLIAQACRPALKGLGIGCWTPFIELARAYEVIMVFLIFMPVVVLSWLPFVSEFQTRFLFNQAFGRGLQISMILAGKRSA